MEETQTWVVCQEEDWSNAMIGFFVGTRTALEEHMTALAQPFIDPGEKVSIFPWDDHDLIVAIISRDPTRTHFRQLYTARLIHQMTSPGACSHP